MAERPAYAAHELIVGPYRARSGVIRLTVGLVLIVVVAFGLNSALSAALINAFPNFWMTEMIAPVQGGTPASLLVLLFSFGFLTLGVFFVVAALLRMAPHKVFGPIPLAVRQFRAVLRALLIVGMIILILPPYDMGQPLERNLETGLWVRLLPLSILAVLVQVGSEELLFRGYLQQGLAARFASPWIWIGLPSILFAAGHYAPQEAGENAIVIVVWAGLFGVLMADLTARAGTLGPAIAVHFVNNVTSLLFVSVPDNLNGLSLYTVPFSMADTTAMRAWLPVDFATMLVAWLAARLVLRR